MADDGVPESIVVGCCGDREGSPEGLSPDLLLSLDFGFDLIRSRVGLEGRTSLPLLFESWSTTIGSAVDMMRLLMGVDGNEKGSCSSYASTEAKPVPLIFVGQINE